MAPRYESALIVPVPAADPFVGDCRDRFDPACGWGVPAHITVLYPFIPPDELDGDAVEELRRMFAKVESFDFALDEVGWFDDEVAWLRPTPGEPFVRLTELVTDHWPEYPPYQGAHDELVPHLTLAQGETEEARDEAVESVRSQLPIPARAREVWLMTGTQEPASWTTYAAFPLADESPV